MYLSSKEGNLEVFLFLGCSKCEGHTDEAVEQEEKLCDEVETVREFTYLGDRVSPGGGCEADLTART